MKGNMADYFTNFSLILPIKDDAQKQYALSLSQTASTYRYEDTPLPADYPDQLKEVMEDWTFETEAEDDGIWLHSESGGIDAVCAFIQHLLQKFNIAPFVAFEWSHDCSKPRTDAFGGGAAFITAKEIKTINTSDWLRSVGA
jgi:hypothetical protein